MDDLTQEIYDRAEKIAAIRARESGEDKWAFKDDDTEEVKKWVMDGTLKAAVNSGIIKYNSGEAPEPDVLPDEQLQSVVYYLLWMYYSALGAEAIKEALYWKALHEEELKRYRFDPNEKSTATRPYNVGL
jgi:hypothetical protein